MERASEGKRERTLEGMYSCVTGLYRRPNNKRSHICAQSFHVGRHFLIVSYRNEKRLCLIVTKRERTLESNIYNTRIRVERKTVYSFLIFISQWLQVAFPCFFGIESALVTVLD